MNVSSFAIGPEVATQLPRPSHSSLQSFSTLSTVLDVLHVIDPPGTPKAHPGMWTVANHVSECAGLVLEDMPIEMLREIEPELSIWLKQRRYSAKSVATFVYNLRKLVQRADDLGCAEATRAMRESWHPILFALKAVKRAPKNIVQFAIARGKTPAKFTDADLEEWAAWMQRRGRKHRTIRILKGIFRKTIRETGLACLLPMIDMHPGPSVYRIRVIDMPDPLRREVIELLAWKQAPFAKGRPQKTRHRAVSAKLLESSICRLYGFWVNVSGNECNRLADLFTEEIVTAYFEWGINTRKLARTTLLRLAMLYSAIRYHPKYKALDISWFQSLVEEIPEDSVSAIADRKAKKSVSHEVLLTIPQKIRAERQKTQIDSIAASWLVHDELLIAWPTTLPWRQRNIRECRIGEPESGNLFFAPLPRMTHIARPQWVEELLQSNPEQSFWQFFFREHETKTGQQIRGIVPRRLVPLLQEYLQEHRPKLVGASDPGTLFLNRDGGALERQTTTELIAELVLKYTGRRMTPHLFRDAFAYSWLEKFPEDYLTLSKALWHRSIKYTLSVYGRNFDESNAARRTDEWLGAE